MVGSGRAIVLGNFKYLGILLIWIVIGQGLTVFPVVAVRVCLDIFSGLSYHFSLPLPIRRQLDIDLITVSNGR